MRLEINQKEKRLLFKKKKKKNTWRLSNILLSNQCITEEAKEEVKKYLQTNENESMTIQNQWDTVKLVLKGKFK